MGLPVLLVVFKVFYSMILISTVSMIHAERYRTALSLIGLGIYSVCILLGIKLMHDVIVSIIPYSLSSLCLLEALMLTGGLHNVLFMNIDDPLNPGSPEQSDSGSLQQSSNQSQQQLSTSISQSGYELESMVNNYSMSGFLVTQSNVKMKDIFERNDTPLAKNVIPFASEYNGGIK